MAWTVTNYPLVMTNRFAIENCPFYQLIYGLKLVIFHSFCMFTRGYSLRLAPLSFPLRTWSICVAQWHASRPEKKVWAGSASVKNQRYWVLMCKLATFFAVCLKMGDLTIRSRRGQRPVGRRHDQHYLILSYLVSSLSPSSSSSPSSSAREF